MKFKKIFISLFLLLLMTALVACSETESSVERKMEKINIQNPGSIVENIQLPKKIDGRGNLTWTSSNRVVVSIEEYEDKKMAENFCKANVLRPKGGEEDVTLILTATFTLKGKVASEQFEITVLADSLTVAEASAFEIDAEVIVIGIIISRTNDGFYLKDDSGSIFVSEDESPQPDTSDAEINESFSIKERRRMSFAVGETVRVFGSIALKNGTKLILSSKVAKINTGTIPKYEHILYQNNINQYIHFTTYRRYKRDTDNSFNVSYGVSVTNTSSEEGEDNIRENLKFSMSALTVLDKMYYFSDMSGFNTPISHSYSMQKLEVDKTYNTDYIDQTPKAFFINTSYQKTVLDAQNNITKEWVSHSLKEELMLELIENNKNIYSSTDVSVDGLFTIIIEVDKNPQSEVERYSTKFTIDVPDKTKRYHIDMQSWLVDEKGDSSTHVGVYGYKDSLKNYVSMGRIPIDARFNAKCLYIKVNYYDELGNNETLLYKNDLENLVTSINN